MTSLHPARPTTRHNNSTRNRGRGRATTRPAASVPASFARPVAPADSAVNRLDAALSSSASTPASPDAAFTDYALPTEIIDVLARSGIVRPTAIQAKTLGDALAGRDVLGRAQTGSGKTLAFGLPMLTRLSGSVGRRSARDPRGLVLVPTRELAQQVADAIAPSAGAVGLHVAVVVGGVSINKQITELRRGVDVLIATPGRLLDLMQRDAVRLDVVQTAVLDEADHMADLGFLPAVTRILDATPDGRQCLLFSATLDRAVGKLVSRYLSDPALHAAGPTAASAEDMDHEVFLAETADKIDIAAEIGARPGRTLFFVRTKHGADRLAKQLTRLGVDSAAIHGNLNQNQRTRALEAFSTGRSRVLTATDVAARGIHVDDLDLVVHFDPPVDHKTYLHRSGRTARAGAHGTVVSLVSPDQARDVATMHKLAGVAPRITRVRPGHQAVRRLAESGEPIAVPAPAARTATTPRAASAPGPAGGTAHRPQRRRPRSTSTHSSRRS